MPSSGKRLNPLVTVQVDRQHDPTRCDTHRHQHEVEGDHPANAKTSFGLVGVPIVVLDEPGSLETRGGEMLADALFSAQGKPGSALKVICAGTLAPMATSAGHWWFDLVEGGTKNTTFVLKYQGDLEDVGPVEHHQEVQPTGGSLTDLQAEAVAGEKCCTTRQQASGEVPVIPLEPAER